MDTMTPFVEGATPHRVSMTIKDKTLTILSGYGAMIVWVLFFHNFMGLIRAQFLFRQPSELYIFVTSCVMAPIVEELIFRKAVIDIFRNTDYIIPIIILSSALFGWLHGGAQNLWIQGVFGVVFSWVYIKNNYCYWSSVILHSMWNLTVTFLVSFR